MRLVSRTKRNPRYVKTKTKVIRKWIKNKLERLITPACLMIVSCTRPVPRDACRAPYSLCPLTDPGGDKHISMSLCTIALVSLMTSSLVYLSLLPFPALILNHARATPSPIWPRLRHLALAQRLFLPWPRQTARDRQSCQHRHLLAHQRQDQAHPELRPHPPWR